MVGARKCIEELQRRVLVTARGDWRMANRGWEVFELEAYIGFEAMDLWKSWMWQDHIIITYHRLA